VQAAFVVLDEDQTLPVRLNKPNNRLIDGKKAQRSAFELYAHCLFDTRSIHKHRHCDNMYILYIDDHFCTAAPNTFGQGAVFDKRVRNRSGGGGALQSPSHPARDHG